MSVTQIIIFGTLCVLGLYDIFAVVYLGEAATISRFVQNRFFDSPFATFVIGVLFGHFGLLLPRKKKDE
jgi:hypothetical protein